MAKTGLVFAVILMLVAVGAPAISAEQEALVVVVNAARPETNVSRIDLMGIFLGHALYWADRSETEIVPILPPTSDLVATLKFHDFIGMPPNKLKQKWSIKIAARVARRPPVQPKDSAEALDRLSSFAGGIAVLTVSSLKSSPRASEFRTLTIDGLGPNDSGYALAK